MTILSPRKSSHAARGSLRPARVLQLAALLLSLLIAFSSCTASPSRTPDGSAQLPSRPSPTAAPPEPVRIPVIWKPQVQLSFDFERDVSSEDRGLIRKALKQAVRLFPYPHLRALRPALIAVFVHSRNEEMSRPNEIAEVRGRSIHIFVESDGWKGSTFVQRRQAMFHEWVHVVQGLETQVFRVPVWLIEGSAEWSAWDAIFRLGLASRSFIRRLGEQAASLIDGARTLRRLEGGRFYRNDPNARNYTLAYLAVDFLHPGRGWRTIVSFFRATGAGSTWQAAFKRVFKISVSRFYRSFEADRAAGFPG